MAPCRPWVSGLFQERSVRAFLDSPAFETRLLPWPRGQAQPFSAMSWGDSKVGEVPTSHEPKKGLGVETADRFAAGAAATSDSRFA
jgi:hypothetical protein